MRSLRDRYFGWLYNLVYDPVYFENKSYKQLFRTLDSIEFYYVIPMDANRADDGYQLRYRFGHEIGIPDSEIAVELDIHPVTVLEVLVALSLRIEESIMGDDEIGNRTGKWIFVMLNNLGLSDMYDQNPAYDDGLIFAKINTLLERDYSPNGEGGLFFIKHPRQDLRITDIWYQAMWYLTENYH